MSQIDQKQVSKAVKALMNYLSKQKEKQKESSSNEKSLLPESDGDYILLNITTKSMPDKASVKPIPM